MTSCSNDKKYEPFLSGEIENFQFTIGDIGISPNSVIFRLDDPKQATVVNKIINLINTSKKGKYDPNQESVKKIPSNSLQIKLKGGKSYYLVPGNGDISIISNQDHIKILVHSKELNEWMYTGWRVDSP